MKSCCNRRVGPTHGILIALAFTASAAQAAVIYTTESAFNSALQAGSYTEDFSGVSGSGVLTGINSLPFSGSGISYTIATSTDVFYLNTIDGRSLATAQQGASMIITLSTPNITAIGGNFSSTDDTESIIADSFLLTLSDGTTSTLNSPAGGPSTFRGFSTTGGTFITSLTIDGAGIGYSTINNLTVGFAAVPEPSVIASVTALGLVGAAAATRRFRRR
ncbi:MAG: hypothetical protein IT580_10165 [Verrucomicrobiales bacterium]|nr:hypothetical protein [Verrucomicrobiales bacterium]